MSILEALFRHASAAPQQLKEDLTTFFTQNQPLMVEVLQAVDEGNLYKMVVKSVLDKTALALRCPFRAVKAIVDMELPCSRYEVFASTNEVLGADGKFQTAVVEGVKVPNFWAPQRVVRELWKKIKGEFNIQGDKDSHYWHVKDMMAFIYSNETYAKYLEEPRNVELIVRGDGMSVGSNPSCFLICTLGNFGIYSKTLWFNFPICIMNFSEKDREAVCKAAEANLLALNEWQHSGFLEVLPGYEVKIRVEWGGDEAWLRILLGLLSSKEGLACLLCYWLRGMKYDPSMRVDRVLSAFPDFFLRGTLDHKNMPMITEGDISQVHNCAMHSIMAFGKDLCEVCGGGGGHRGEGREKKGKR